MKLLYDITLHDYIHFNNTNQKANSGNMHVDLMYITVKKRATFFTLLT